MTYLEQFTRIIRALNKADVKYMIVGGYAVNAHGYSRNTMDLAIWIDTSEDNLKKLYQALNSLGYKENRIHKALNHLKNNHMIKIPLDNTKVEFIDAYMMKDDFDEAFQNHIEIKAADVKLKFIGFDDLIRNKAKSNRMKDLLDVKNLKELKKLRNLDKSE